MYVFPKNITNQIKRFIVKKYTQKNNLIERINSNVAGIDIGAHSIFVCAGSDDGHQEVREFLTFTADLNAAADWLKKRGITSVAMESTGSYWISTYEILEDAGFEVFLVNAHYLKTVPGRKTDVKDCQWIQQLHSYGLLQGSFRPDNHGVMFRSYVRQRGKLVELTAAHIQLMNKALIQMNIRLDQVFSVIAGDSSMAIIRSIVAGETDPKVLAKHRDPRCKKKADDIIKALEGNYRKEHLFSLKQALNAYDFFHTQLAECDSEVKKILEDWNEKAELSAPAIQDANLRKTKKQNKKNCYNFNVNPFLENITGVNLTEIPGIDTNTAMKIIAEIGVDMSHWKTSKHFISWLGLCPGNKISGGKILSSRTVPIQSRAKRAFLLAANALHRSKTALGAFFRRIRSRLGAPKAITATAHKIAKIVYHMLKDHKKFKDVGQEAYENKFRLRKVASLKRMAADLGFCLLEKQDHQVA